MDYNTTWTIAFCTFLVCCAIVASVAIIFNPITH